MLTSNSVSNHKNCAKYISELLEIIRYYPEEFWIQMVMYHNNSKLIFHTIEKIAEGNLPLFLIPLTGASKDSP